MFILDKSDEVGIELKRDHDVPYECTHNFLVDFVWKSVSFDRFGFVPKFCFLIFLECNLL